ncbi:receptor-interacting serine/threonine-protein kinase 1-like [Apostichopus japonicus]|uniref:receptor-interacting serine/threonine-protein kinase 1-like n=1 Tax=Stichopus japonicus TaxID=307972 RepID=UPI003AB5C98B
MKELIPQIGLRLKFVARLKAYRQDSSTTSEQPGISRQYEFDNEYQSTKTEASLHGVVSDGSIERLSGAISKNWREIGRKLEISDEDLDRIQSDTTEGRKETVYEMLRKWKQQNGRNATYKRLGDALKKCGRTDLQEDLGKEAEGLSKGSTVPTNQSDYTNEPGGEELQFNGMQKKRSLDYIILVSCVFIVAIALGRNSSS